MPDPIDNSNIIADIASKHLGAPPAAASPAADAGGAPPTPQSKSADPAPTSMERAQSKVAPTDSADAAADSVSFLKVGDREYTEQQIKGTLDRYRDLNFRWQSNKPVVDVVQRIVENARKNGHDPKPEEVAGLVDAAVNAFLKNPQLGGDGKKSNETGDGKPGMSGKAQATLGDNDDDDEAMLAQWETENAVKLPPGFRENAKQTKAMSAKLDQVLGLFDKIISGGLAGQQSADQAAQQVQVAQGMQANAATQMITNNLNVAFQQAGIPVDPQVRGDFRMFAAQRGYDFPDFMDAALTATVVADYKANKDAPEVARLRQVAQKRQAFTGMTDGAPGAGAGAAPAAKGDPMLESLVASAMQSRGLAGR